MGTTGAGAAAVAIAILTWTSAAATPQARSGACPPPATVAARCTAAAPAAGVAFSGPVLEVIDGGAVCVALGPLPSQWVRVDLADAPLDGTRGRMMAAAFARNVKCLSAGPAGDGVRALCISDGVSVGALANVPQIRDAAQTRR
jgi:hypothetical protein